MFLSWIVMLPAYAQEDSFARRFFSPYRFTGHADFRAGIANGEPSWRRNGFGKARFGSDGNGLDGDLEFSEASLVWKPMVSSSIDAHIHAQVREGQEKDIDLVEGFLTYRAPPSPIGRFKIRGGLMFPPISLEHETSGAWTPRFSITPSAINSWIGEEVWSFGLVPPLEKSIGDHRLAVTASGFGFNDTAGTLLAFRGWALHDVKATAFSGLALPDSQPGGFRSMFTLQGELTEPVEEIDGRIGYYAGLSWKAPHTLAINVLHYDNNGNRDTVIDGQYSWETQFNSIGVTLDLTPRTTVLAQGMFGRTQMGFLLPAEADVDFAAAYVLVNHSWENHFFTGRADFFGTTDNTFVLEDNNNEKGWAAMVAYGYTVNKNANLIAEVMRIDSNRASRITAGLNPEQEQIVIQLNARFGF